MELFRPLDTYKHPVAALEMGPYRLYGLRFDDELFVAGAGAAKFVRAIRDDPEAEAAYDDVRHAARRLQNRLKRRGLNHPPRDDRGLLYLPDDLLTFA